MRFTTSILFLIAIFTLSMTQSCTSECGDDDFAGDDDSSADDDDSSADDDDDVADDDESDSPAFVLRFEDLWSIGPMPIPIYPCEEDLPLLTFVAESRNGPSILVTQFGFMMMARTEGDYFNAGPIANTASSARFACELWNYDLLENDSFLIGNSRSSDYDTGVLEYSETFQVSSADALLLTIVCDVSCDPVGNVTDFTMDLRLASVMAQDTGGSVVEIVVNAYNQSDPPNDPTLWYRME